MADPNPAEIARQVTERLSQIHSQLTYAQRVWGEAETKDASEAAKAEIRNARNDLDRISKDWHQLLDKSPTPETLSSGLQLKASLEELNRLEKAAGLNERDPSYATWLDWWRTPKSTTELKIDELGQPLGTLDWQMKQRNATANTAAPESRPTQNVSQPAASPFSTSLDGSRKLELKGKTLEDFYAETRQSYRRPDREANGKVDGLLRESQHSPFTDGVTEKSFRHAMEWLYRGRAVGRGSAVAGKSNGPLAYASAVFGPDRTGRTNSIQDNLLKELMNHPGNSETALKAAANEIAKVSDRDHPEIKGITMLPATIISTTTCWAPGRSS